jgi:general secretion pathway protein D
VQTISIRLFHHSLYLGLLILMLIGCTAPPVKKVSPTIPEPLRSPVQSELVATPLMPSEKPKPDQPRTRFQTLPLSPIHKAVSEPAADQFIPPLKTTAPIRINVEGLPLPAFINEVFGNLLGLSFEIEAALQNRKELVTLRVTEPQKPPQLYRLARQVLTNYGVAIQAQNHLLRFIQASKGGAAPPPLLASGLTLPHVPPSHRHIIQFVPMKVVHSHEIRTWVKDTFEGHPLKVVHEPERNALVLIGPPQIVQQAVEVVQVLDQPFMRGRYSLRIEPAFLPVDKLANQLREVLTGQGYSAVQGARAGYSVMIFPIRESNSILVFAADPKVLAHIQQWAEQLDRLNIQPTNDKPGLFFYPVKHTSASTIVNVINQILQDHVRSERPKQVPRGTSSLPQSPMRMMVDGPRNAILFSGNNEEWARLLPLLQEMDRPIKQVLIEATIAEITMSEKDDRGIEWVLNKADLGGLDGQLGTLNKLGVGGSAGLTYTLSNAGQARAVLNAFASNSRATILSTPRLLVSSGHQASIDIGTEIPTLSSTTTGLQTDSNVIQQIQYRRTGTSLTIKPTVYAGRRVDLTISQQISESQPNETSSIDSPVIFNRTINTHLSLNDGHSVLLGGMISNSRSEGRSGIPILSDIPLIGQLFRVNKSSDQRTELIIMIIPYVIDGDEEAKAITEAFKRQLKWLTPNNQ